MTEMRRKAKVGRFSIERAVAAYLDTLFETNHFWEMVRIGAPVVIVASALNTLWGLNMNAFVLLSIPAIYFIRINYLAFAKGRKLYEGDQKAARMNANQDIVLSELARKKLRSVEGWINTARSEFASRTVGRFWDALNEAAGNLSYYNTIVKSLKDWLAKEHPKDPVFDIGDARPLIRELGALIRQGESDYQFAMILEQRRLRQELERELAGIQDTLQKSLAEVERELSDVKVPQAVSEEITRRLDQQTSILDNIQRHRKPFP